MLDRLAAAGVNVYAVIDAAFNPSLLDATAAIGLANWTVEVWSSGVAALDVSGLMVDGIGFRAGYSTSNPLNFNLAAEWTGAGSQGVILMPMDASNNLLAGVVLLTPTVYAALGGT